MSQQASSTVARAVAVLFELSRSPQGVAITDLAQRVDTQRASLYRILKALEDSRLVRRDEHKLYRVSYGLAALAASAMEPLEQIARPLLQSLADRSDCTAMLLFESGGDIITSLCVTPNSPGMHVTTQPGFVHPQGRVASRVVIEASRPELPDDPEDVREARRKGYASSTMSARGGRRYGIASPVGLNALGQDGCLLLVTLDEVTDESALAEMIVETAAELTSHFGR